MGSLYSMKPKPFISLTSVMSPVPWVAKWASTSALVAVGIVSVASLGSGRAMMMDHCEGGSPSKAGWQRPRSCCRRERGKANQAGDVDANRKSRSDGLEASQYMRTRYPGPVARWNQQKLEGLVQSKIWPRGALGVATMMMMMP